MAAERRLSGAVPPAFSGEGRQAIVLREFRDDLAHWIASDRGTALRVLRMIEEVLRDPFSGIGKPEALKHDQHGRWSRRVTDRDRLLYLVRGAAIYFLAARWHYQRR